jgi:chromosome segregation ATPase
MSIEYNKLKDQISSTQSTISSTKSQISLVESSITRLTQEKRDIETSIAQLRSTLQSQKSDQITQRSQINEANSVKTEVTVLHGAAGATTASVKDVVGQLLELKQALNDCVAALDAGTTEVHVETYAFGKMGLRKSRQKLELVPEALITQAVEALSSLGTKIPAM